MTWGSRSSSAPCLPETRGGAREALEIDGLGADGEGVGRLDDGRVAFVFGALPGDLVSARITHLGSKVVRAELAEILRPSPRRRPSPCGTAACTNCALRELSLETQREHKRRRVVEALRRIGKLDIEDILPPLTGEGDGLTYRHRVRLHVAERGGFALGYHARKSHELVTFDSCPVMWPELMQVVRRLREVLAEPPYAAMIREVEVAYSRCEQAASVLLVCSKAWRGGDDVLARLRAHGVRSLMVRSPGETRIFGREALRYDYVPDLELSFAPGSFTQANPEVNRRLVAAVTAAARPCGSEPMLELYAGVGNFSLALARDGRHVTAVEGNQGAAHRCQQNAARAGLALAVHHDTDLAWAARLEEFYALVLDPPRAGAKDIIKSAAASRALTRVIYVSCDPATAARDLAALAAGGFVIERALAFDMFPMTPHVETMFCLTR